MQLAVIPQAINNLKRMWQQPDPHVPAAQAEPGSMKHFCMTTSINHYKDIWRHCQYYNCPNYSPLFEFAVLVARSLYYFWTCASHSQLCSMLVHMYCHRDSLSDSDCAHMALVIAASHYRDRSGVPLTRLL